MVSSLAVSHENAICSIGAGPARRFNAVGDHALGCRRLRKVVCCHCNFRGPLLEERQAPRPASERIYGDNPVGASLVAVCRVDRDVRFAYIYYKSTIIKGLSPTPTPLLSRGHKSTRRSVVHWYNCHALLPCVAQATHTSNTRT